MKLIGLTGGIACGKTVVSEFFKQLGAHVIDLDRIAREVVEPDREAWRDIVEYFGEGVLLPDRTIDRAKLGEIVFNDSAALKKLNEFTHARIGQEMAARVEELSRRGIEAVIVEAALLAESGMNPMFDAMIVVFADTETQINRMKSRNGYTDEEAKARISSQMPVKDKLKYADYAIDNSGDLENARRQVKEVWSKIMSQPG